MRKIVTASLAALSLLLAPSAIASPETAAKAVAQEENGYQRLFDVLTSDTDNMGALRIAEIVVNSMSEQQPVFAEIETDQPGFIANMEAAMLPIVQSYLARMKTLYGPQFVRDARTLVSNEEAAEIADFYESDMGQTLLAASRRNITMEASNEELLSGDPFTRADVERDVAATTNSALMEIPQRDLAEVNRYLETQPQILANLERLREPLLQMRIRMDNESMNAAENAAMSTAFSRVLKRYGYERLAQ